MIGNIYEFQRRGRLRVYRRALIGRQLRRRFASEIRAVRRDGRVIRRKLRRRFRFDRRPIRRRVR